MENPKLFLEMIEKDGKLREKLGNRYLPALMENISQIRGLIEHFIMISSGIIGFTIPVFGRTDLIKNEVFLIGGLLELVIVIVFGYFYLTKILQKENRRLWRDFRTYHSHIDKLVKARNIWYEDLENKTKFRDFQQVCKRIDGEMKQCEQEVQDDKDYNLDLIFFAFLAGLILIIASMITFNCSIFAG